MLDKFYYRNTKGQLLTFGASGIYANYNDLRDYEWIYDTTDEVISNFRKGIAEKSLPLIFLGRYGRECREARNNAFEIVETDVIAGKKGRLYIGEWYLNCWIYGISNSDYLVSERLIASEFKVVTDDPVWRTEKTLQFAKTQEAVSSSGFEFPFEFPFDFMQSIHSKTSLQNEFPLGADFRIAFYGTAYNPSVAIGGHTYAVNCNLVDGERVEICSADKTVIKYGVGGASQNYFNKRYKEESVFERIKAGVQTLSWNGEFDFDLTLIANRSEPVWGWTEGPPIDSITDATVIDKRYYLLDSDGEFITDSDGDYITVDLPPESEG